MSTEYIYTSYIKITILTFTELVSHTNTVVSAQIGISVSEHRKRRNYTLSTKEKLCRSNM